MLAFVDLETTGLKAEEDAVLEVACIITDDKLVEVARFESVVHGTAERHTTDEFVRNMHTINGLWDAIDSDETPWSLDTVDDQFAAFIREHAVRVFTDAKGKKSVDRPQLAGNTISFDRAFMKKHLPRAEAELHYRNIDISSMNEMARRFCPAMYSARPQNPEVAHRAMADTEESLRLARYYASAAFQSPT